MCSLSNKVYIALQVPKGPKGGSFQFLNALENQFMKKGRLSCRPSPHDMFIFSASQQVFNVLELKKKMGDSLFFHRIDGPIRLYNLTLDRRDKIVEKTNREIADGTIFQSEWSRQENYRLGFQRSPFETVIHNAPNPSIFNKNNRIIFSKNRKTKLIAVSWSSNWKKGFKTYQWLDKNLDFNSYSMTFIGNSPINFKNIRHLNPLDSHQLADELRNHDIFIFPSEVEACSNSLLEALSCGLPAIVKNASSNPEILKKGGELFSHHSEIPMLLEQIISNYSNYQEHIRVQSLEEVADLYYDFMLKVKEDLISGRYKPKATTFISRISLKINLKIYIFQQKLLMKAIRVMRLLNDAFSTLA